jgi:hypothetical protein
MFWSVYFQGFVAFFVANLVSFFAYLCHYFANIISGCEVVKDSKLNSKMDVSCFKRGDQNRVLNEVCSINRNRKQLEWLTGGVVFAGYHEVVINEKVLSPIEIRCLSRLLLLDQGTCCNRCKEQQATMAYVQLSFYFWKLTDFLVGVSSTLFSHIASDQTLVPLPIGGRFYCFMIIRRSFFIVILFRKGGLHVLVTKPNIQQSKLAHK